MWARPLTLTAGGEAEKILPQVIKNYKKELAKMPDGKRRRRRAPRPAAKKKIYVKFRLLLARLRGRRDIKLTLFEICVAKRERFSLAAVALAAAYLVATWLAKH